LIPPKEIRIEDYNYSLPEEHIAKYPLSPRDSSKLLVYKNGEIASNSFQNLAENLPDNAHLVFNNTKVIPARLYFQKKTGAVIEVFLLDPFFPSNIISQVMESEEKVIWHCMIGNKKKWKGEVLELKIPIARIEESIFAELVDREENKVSFTWKAKISFSEIVKAIGEIPLPPYLNRKTEVSDLETYQTVYSKFDGAVAAPTAGLHFTKAIFDRLNNANFHSSYITLHIGAGTFQPVKTENALEHHMHSEQIVFERSFIEKLIENNGPVIPVGTTSMRSLESLYWFGVKVLNEKLETIPFKIEKLDPYKSYEKLPSKSDALQGILDYMVKKGLNSLIGDTEIFIFPGYSFKLCDGLITNFHQPKSTLLLLVSALIGDKWKEVYDFAKAKKYRFLSYGDSSLLLPN
jgi:S-adenosylmethionine:tRNA ribosyltransferase-isomerase